MSKAVWSLSVPLAISLGLVCGQAIATPTVWTGPNVTFTKANGADPNLPANQDRMTSDIWITRDGAQGLYNAFSESGFIHFDSPQGTEWANGLLANYGTLTYTDWNTWAKGVNAGPPSTVGVNAVLHLIPDDIYLSIKFTSWTSGGAGGGFSYDRSTVPEPSTALILGAAGVLCRLRRRGSSKFAR